MKTTYRQLHGYQKVLYPLTLHDLASMPPSNPPTSPSPTHFQSPTRSPASPAPPPASTTFTAHQRSLQARAKPYNAPESNPHSGPTHEQAQGRKNAREVLQNSELLFWYSIVRNESVAATRAHFENVQYGFDNVGDENGGLQEGVVWREEWEVPVEERVRDRKKEKEKEKEKERKRRRGSGRASLGRESASGSGSRSSD